ncbi:hypothetical protein ACFFX0_27635 [Citricoccus parietis]|uniref:Uncharacterized protein n=1 Tax=Citricoccus parietis TaxID=592307 RepID=A0ABV5G732_9MICC
MGNLHLRDALSSRWNGTLSKSHSPRSDGHFVFNDAPRSARQSVDQG